MQRSRYPGQRDRERDRIERFYQLVSGILRRALQIDEPPAQQAGGDTQAEDEDASGPGPDEKENT